MTTPQASHGTALPQVVAVYGWLGLIPFFAPPLVAWAVPSLAGLACIILVAYGALILSFLGGARWGLAVAKAELNVVTVSLAMLPTLAALALVAAPSVPATWRLDGLAAALALHWIWDVRSGDLPLWYPRLRTALTSGAIAGLLLGSIVLPG